MSASIAVAVNTICIGPVFLPLSFEMEIGDLKRSLEVLYFDTTNLVISAALYVIHVSLRRPTKPV